MKVTNKLILQERIQDIEQDIVSTIQTNNKIMEDYFTNLSFFSSLLPEYLGRMTVLADQVSDVLVIQGNTKLSKLTTELPILSRKGIDFNSKTNTIQLSKVSEYNYQINAKQSYILSPSNNYTILDSTNGNISSLQDFLSLSNSVILKSSDRAYKYTFSLSLSSKSLINNIQIVLDKATESYPLISEIYYINDDNQKVNCFILNSQSNSIDLDLYRQEDNKVNLNLHPFQSSRVFITFEDFSRSELSLKALELQRVKYESEGEITFGPLISELPLLKASLSASASEGVKYFISHNNNDYLELIRSEDIDIKSNASKIVRYNTVNTNSISSNTDIKQLYLKIKMIALDAGENEDLVKYRRESFSSSFHTIYNNTLKDSVVYSDLDLLSYGATKRYMSYPIHKAIEKSTVKIEENGRVKVKGFIDSEISYSSVTDVLAPELKVTTLPLKTGGTAISCAELDPYSVNLYGYILNKNRQKDFNTDSKDIVLKLKDEYSKGIYRIRQGNKEIEVDLSLGYINSCSDVIIVVEDKETLLLDELGNIVKNLSLYVIDEIFTINLVKENLFELPLSINKEFNMEYPFVLNTIKSFSIENNQIVNTERLIDLSNVYTLSTEKIDTSIKISKENNTQVVVEDLNLLTRYTKEGKDFVSAFTTTKAIKLKNKNIKKGSLNLTKYSDPYLTEVNFIDGIQEFSVLAYKKEIHTVNTDQEFMKSLELTTNYEIEDIDNIQISIKDRYEVKLEVRYVTDQEKNKIIVYTDDFILNQDQIEITYLYTNSQPTNFFSLDYDNGILFLSSSTNANIELVYEFFVTFVTGSKATQLNTNEYNVVDNIVEIKEQQENMKYLVIYNYNTLLDVPKSTPSIQNVKINYINTSDSESLL